MSGVAPLSSAGIAYSDSKAKSDILNEQFCSVFTDEDLCTIPSLGSDQHPDMQDINVSVTGVTKLLMNINLRKASGPDKIPGRLLQGLASEIAPALTLLYNRSLVSGKVPTPWKHALVQPIFKKGDRSRAVNYRPISLTCICCKMLEHVVRSEISYHLDLNNIISDAQHGFRKKRSCETQLVLTVDDLASNIDANSQTDIILLDFSKAFDKVPHQRLLVKLAYYGIRGSTLTWISNFLGSRTQQVVVEGQLSATGAVTSGVPQGSVLGPTLFLVYINDIAEDIDCVIRLFADDTVLYNKIDTLSDVSRLQSDLNKLGEWEHKWQMSFNVEKCHSLTVSLRRKPIPSVYKLHGHTLEQVDDAKYLGLTTTKNLSWNKHIHGTAAKASRTSAFVHRNLKGCPKTVHTQCYKSLVRPILKYASPVWSPQATTLIHEIEMVQRRAARRISRDYRRTTSASALVSNLGLDTLKHRRDINSVTMMYKVINGVVDVHPHPGTITPAGRTTRVQHRLMVPYTRTNVKLHSFFPTAIRMWNSIPGDAVSATTVDAFKAALRGWSY